MFGYWAGDRRQYRRCWLVRSETEIRPVWYVNTRPSSSRTVTCRLIGAVFPVLEAAGAARVHQNAPKPSSTTANATKTPVGSLRTVYPTTRGYPGPSRAARESRYRCSGMLSVRRAASWYCSRAPARSPAISSRCARTAASRW